MVQNHAMRAWKEGLNFRELVLKDKSITSRVPRAQIERAFDLKRQLRNIDKIFARVFGGRAEGDESSPEETPQQTPLTIAFSGDQVYVVERP